MIARHPITTYSRANHSTEPAGDVIAVSYVIVLDKLFFYSSWNFCRDNKKCHENELTFPFAIRSVAASGVAVVL